VYWNSARTGTRAFVGGAANPTETFSSDGPRRIFYNPNGTPITLGNFLFGTNGGLLLIKPDMAAADGVGCRTPGFFPFFGTSAAAPHAAAVAALIKSAKPGLTNAQIYQAMISTALDIRAAGIDRDSGYGIVMAPQSISKALSK
jgi:subtilisin family serine protease